MCRPQAFFLTAIVALFGAACASGGGGASVSGNTVTAAQLEDSPFSNAYEILDRHNAVAFRGGEMYIRGRGAGRVGTPTPMYLTIDGTSMGGGAEVILRGIAKENIERIQIMRPTEATTRFGVQAGGGAVLIQLKRN